MLWEASPRADWGGGGDGEVLIAARAPLPQGVLEWSWVMR